MSAIILKNITVELSVHEDSFLTDIAHLILEFSANGQIVGRVDLLSRESTTGVWASDKAPVFNGTAGEFMASVWMEFDTNDRQLLGFIELNGSQLHDAIGKQFEVPMKCHQGYPILVLKTMVMGVENIRALMSSTGWRDVSSYEQDKIENMLKDAAATYSDFNRNGKLETLDLAISQLQTTTESTSKDDPRLPEILSNLGLCLVRRFEQLGGVADINDAITHFETAVDLTPSDHPKKPFHLSKLGVTLRTRFERFGNLADIDRAIRQQQAALDLTSDDQADRFERLDSLGSSLVIRFRRTGNTDDVDNAILLQQAAVDLISDGHSVKSGPLNNLGNSFHIRFLHSGNMADLDIAISRLQTAVDSTPNKHPSKPMYLSNLGNCLGTRFMRLGNIADIDDAISRQQEAVDLTPQRNYDKIGRLNNLGGCLFVRFMRFGNVSDIDDAILRQQMAVDLTPEGQPKSPGHLCNLGASLHKRFERFGNIIDLNNAILRQQAAVDLTSDDHPEKSLYLSSLGSSLNTRFERYRNVADMDNAILHHTAAVNLTPDGHSSKPMYLSNLGNCLRTRFEQFGNLAEIDHAILRLQAAVDLTPDGHPERSSYLTNLANSFRFRFRHFQHTHDAEMAIFNFSAAANSPVGPPSVRFQAASAWIDVSYLVNHDSLLTAYERALGLMPLVAWLGFAITDRHRHLIRMGGITRDAVAAAIENGQYEKALEWLEQGRSIVWTQILQLRTPVDQLQDVDPDLVDRFLRLSRELDRGVGNRGIPGVDMPTIEEEGRRYRASTTEWESIVEQIRSLPNCENFLRPPKSSYLIKAAQDGPVVVINVAEQRCDALAIIPGFDEVLHIPLPDITASRVLQLGEELKDLLYSSGLRTREERAAQKFSESIDDEDCKQILAELWKGLVKPVMDSLAFSAHPDSLPRIWWCITGPLAFLPIHAAGLYDSNSVDSHLSSYVISSYTPTLSTLLESRKATTSSSFKLLSVIQPSAPGTTYLPNIKQELENIQRNLADRGHVVLEGAEGTRERVKTEMKYCNWLHLACHGIQRPEEPTKSALILHDGHLTLEEIIQLNLPEAEFAFLSACQTTTGDEKLSEEAVHIAGGMLLAGYRGVVATMWSIKD